MRASFIIRILSVRLRHKSKSHTQGQIDMDRLSLHKNPGADGLATGPYGLPMISHVWRTTVATGINKILTIVSEM